MIIKHLSDHIINQTATCGEIHSVLSKADYPGLNVALAPDIKRTHPHFHKGFDEIYFVLDGNLLLRLYDPATDKITEIRLGPNELCVITRGIHHVVAEASEKNRLCVLTVPGFDVTDEHPSDKL